MCPHEPDPTTTLEEAVHMFDRLLRECPPAEAAHILDRLLRECPPAESNGVPNAVDAGYNWWDFVIMFLAGVSTVVGVYLLFF